MPYKMTLEDALALLTVYNEAEPFAVTELKHVNEARRRIREHAKAVLGELNDDQAEC